jgi:hypothetical protein
LTLTKKETKILANKVYYFCEKYYKDSGEKHFPTVKYIVDNLSKPKEMIIIILNLLVQHNYLKKFRNKYYFLDQKIKRKKRVTEKLKQPETINIQENDNKIDKEIPTEIKAKTQIINNNEPKKSILTSILNTLNKIKIDKIIVFKVLIFLSFLGIIQQAVKYNFIGYKDFKSDPDALISAISFTLEAMILFECAIIFYIQESKLKYLFFFLFLIVFTNNFINVMSGQYKTYQNKIFSGINIESNNNQSLKQIYEKEEKEAEKELNQLIDYRNLYNKKLTDNSNDRLSKNELWVIDNRKIPAIEKKLYEIRGDIKSQLQNKDFNQVKELTFYEFVSSIWIFKSMNIQAGFLQFIHYVFITLLLDLLSSISLTLIFFLKKSEKNN